MKNKVFSCATGHRSAPFVRPVIAGLALGTCFLFSEMALAAERPCFPTILVFATSAKSEVESRRQVLVAWTREARKHGEAFASWRLAWEKTIECGRRPDGAFQCRASGKPCGIVQVPGTLPPGTNPVVRPKPGSA